MKQVIANILSNLDKMCEDDDISTSLTQVYDYIVKQDNKIKKLKGLKKAKKYKCHCKGLFIDPKCTKHKGVEYVY